MALPAGVPDYGYVSINEQTDKDSSFVGKMKANPMFPIGIGGGLMALIYSARQFKNRGNTKISVYLIHTRLMAQGAVVGAVTLGVLYSMYNEFIVGKKPGKQPAVRQS